MRSKATITLVALLLLACGENEDKKAFERYEGQVQSWLEEEEELREEFAERIEDLTSYGDEAGFENLLEERMDPFYAEMEKAVRAVEPEGEALREIHGLLQDYVETTRELIGKLEELQQVGVAADERAAPARKELEEARGARQDEVRAVNRALEAAPAAAQRLIPVLRREQDAITALEGRLAGLSQGTDRAEEVLRFLDTDLSTFYEQAKAAVEAADLGAGAEGLKEAVTAYLESAGPVLDAAREIARARGESEERLRQLQQEVSSGYTEAGELMKRYRERAREYRNSLR